MQIGVETFVKGLRDLGYEPTVLKDKPEHVVIDYTVESDFPVNPPTGIHIAAIVHPFQSGGTHPTGGVHRDQAAPFQQALACEWQYWSRPPVDWATSKKTVAAFMSHVWRLWDSQ
jgi:hypothetical protein